MPEELRRRIGVGACAALVAALAGCAVALAQKPPPVDHSAFDEILRKHVAGGLVDYAGLLNEETKLDAYLRVVAAARPNNASREERLAFYINAYNACILRLILDHHGKINSARDIPRPFSRIAFVVGGERACLDDIEKGKLMRELKDPRIHFALACASLSCPALASHAYTSQDIDAELDDAAKGFLRSPANVRVETRKALLGPKYVLRLSSVFRWFYEDFDRQGVGRSAAERQSNAAGRTISADGAPGSGGVPEFVSRYADAAVKKYLENHGQNLTVEYLDYDWRLNEQRAPGQR